MVPEDVGRKAAHMLLEEIHRGGVTDGTHQVAAAHQALSCMLLPSPPGPDLSAAANHCKLKPEALTHSAWLPATAGCCSYTSLADRLAWYPKPQIP